MVSFNVCSKVKTITVIRRLAYTTTATGSQCFHSHPWLCSHVHGQAVNLFPSGMLTKISGSFTGARTDHINSTSTHHISSSLVFSDQTSKLEPETKGPDGSSERGAKPDGKARSIYKRIVALGRDGTWKDILILYKEEKQHFNAVNQHATVMSQLGRRIRQIRTDNPLFKAFLDNLIAKLYSSGIAWIA